MKDAAYAKINLSLDITGRRADGYHTLRTVMQSISLCDTVTLLEGDAGKIEVICSGGAPCGKGNTVYRAAEEFFRRTGKKGSASFRIEKRIPAQAGLGGGSADAAAALRLLNRRFQTGLSAENLREIGLSAGADVPFCVEGGTALAEGIGEKLTVLSPFRNAGSPSANLQRASAPEKRMRLLTLRAGRKPEAVPPGGSSPP